ncbi:hypothetical protein R3W88_029973 [Solanum pinnatisectum]|uniref:DUF4283 domain-containing protein n=1 Tax=Solanum pinnatisectum TaxID=50273 RepID=A0AAV9K823_9SOLN|nr:hypothetical protein R3W88_029973 [Solanum pinnatisectum]
MTENSSTTPTPLLPPLLPPTPYPPDVSSMDTDKTSLNLPSRKEKTSFKDIRPPRFKLTHQIDTDIEMANPLEETTESQVNQATVRDHITLSDMDKERIYKPWCFSIIIKLLGKKMSHKYLRRKLSLLWRPSEELILINLGHD